MCDNKQFLLYKQIKFIMKTLKAFFLIAAFSISFFTANAAIEPVKTTADLQTQVSDLILASDAFEFAEKEALINVKFMITSDSQVIVISTSDDQYDNTLKSILNYKELDITEEMVGKTYILPVRITKK